MHVSWCFADLVIIVIFNMPDSTGASDGVRNMHRTTARFFRFPYLDQVRKSFIRLASNVAPSPYRCKRLDRYRILVAQFCIKYRKHEGKMGAIGQLLLGALLATVLCGSRCTGGKHVNGEDFRSLTGHTATSPTFETNFGSGTQNATSALDGQSGLPSVSPSGLPFYDLVIGVLAVGGESQKAQDEIAIIRRAYDRYNGSQVVMKSTSPVTIRVVIVVGRAGLPDETHIPANGLLLGDFFHVDVQEGYTHIAGKTKAMMALSEHLR